MLSEFYPQLPMYPVYEVVATGEQYATWLQAAVAAGRITRRATYVCMRYETHWLSSDIVQDIRDYGIRRHTIANEIDAVSPQPHQGIKVLLSRTPGREQLDVDEWAQRAFAALVQYVAWTYQPQRHYVVSLSAGYDTRVLLCALSVVGVDWERFQLITWAPECEQAGQVLDAFDARLRARWTAYDGATDYWVALLREPRKVGPVLGDPSRWMDGFHWLARSHRPDDAALLSALWADETLGWALRTKHELVRFWAGRMLEHPSPLATTCRDCLHPYAGLQWLDLLSRYSLAGIEQEPNHEQVRLYEQYSIPDTLKREILRQQCPALLAVPNPRYALVKTKRAAGVWPHTRLSAAARVELSTLHPQHEQPPETLDDCYDPWLQEYQRAAMLAAAKANGVEVVW